MRRRLLCAAAALAALPALANALGRAPEAARERVNPYAGDGAAVAAGRKLYGEHCASCHGADAKGTRRAPSLVSVHLRGVSPGAVEWVLRNGVMAHGMPSWSGLPAERRWQIVTYLASLQKEL
jgi:mono/diheme cytochrome c family protein